MKKPSRGRTQLSNARLSRSLKTKTKNRASRGEISASRAAKQPTGRAYDLRADYGPRHARLLRSQGDLHQLHAQALAGAVSYPGAGGPVDLDSGERGRRGGPGTSRGQRHRHRGLARHERARMGEGRVARDL